MEELQPQGISFTAHGPVFEAGPGWGFYVKRWLNRYGWYLLLVFAIGGAVWRVATTDTPPSAVLGTEADRIILETVQSGDSLTTVARRATTTYILENLEHSLTPGQRVFIEENLKKDIRNFQLRIGQSVDFSAEKIRSLIEESKRLSKSQLEKWERYGRRVRF